MTPQRKGPALREQRHGPGYSGKQSSPDYSALNSAAAKALARELSIILLAADKMASGHGLHFDDFDRLHAAHQHVIRVLADMTGKEVLT